MFDQARQTGPVPTSQRAPKRLGADPLLTDPLAGQEESGQLEDPLLSKPKMPPPRLGGGGPPDESAPSGPPPGPPPGSLPVLHGGGPPPLPSPPPGGRPGGRGPGSLDNPVHSQGSTSTVGGGSDLLRGLMSSPVTRLVAPTRPEEEPRPKAPPPLPMTGKRIQAPPDLAPKDTAPKDGAPKDTAPKGTAPKDGAPKDGAPRQTEPLNKDPSTVPPQVGGDGSSPELSSPELSTPPTLDPSGGGDEIVDTPGSSGPVQPTEIKPTPDDGLAPVLVAPPVDGGISPSKDGFTVDVTRAKDPSTFLGSHPIYQAFSSGKLPEGQKSEVQKTLDTAKSKVQSTSDGVLGQLQNEKNTAQTTELSAKKSGEDEKTRATALSEQQKLQAQKTSNVEKGLATQQGKVQENTTRSTHQGQINGVQSTATQQIQSKERKLNQDKNAQLSQAQRQGDLLKNDAKAKAGDAQTKAGSQSLWDKAKNMASNTWDSIKAGASALWDKATKLAGDLMDKARNLVNQWTAQFQRWVAERKAALKAQIDQIKAALNSALEKVKASVAAKWQEVTTKLKQKFQEISKVVQETWANVKNKVTETVTNAWESAKARGRQLRDGLVSGVTAVWTEVTDTFDSIREGGAGPSPEKELFLTPEERADWIFKAVRGLGTNETLLLRCLNGTPSENAEVARIFKSKYKMDLAAVLQSELSGNQLSQASELLTTGKVSLGTRIERALEGWGGDGDAIASMFESATDDERKAFMHDPKYAEMRTRIIAEAGLEVFNRLSSGADLDGKLLQNESALVARLVHRGAGLGTDEEGTYKDLTDFAKKNPALAKQLAENKDGELYKALANELSGRDLDKALGVLKGGGTRSIDDVMDSETKRWFADEDGIFKALTDMDPKEREAIIKDPARRDKLLGQLRAKLNDSEYAKAVALLDRGKQGGIDKIDEELKGWNTDDRVVLDAVIGMDAGERSKLSADSEKLAILKSGMSVDNYARLLLLLGQPQPNDAGIAAANNRRLAETIIDGADHLLDANEDQVFKAVLDAQALAKKHPPEANLLEILAIISKSGKVPRIVPAYARIYAALEGKAELTSIDRLKQSTVGAGTDDAAMVAMIDDLSGKDLLEHWSNIGEYRAIQSELKDALASKDDKRIAVAQRRSREFILDVNKSVLATIRGDTEGKDRTDVLAKLRKKLRDAAQTDPEFQGALGKTGLKLNELDLEKMEYLQSNEEMDVHRREGETYSVNDLFSSKGKQTDDAHGAYMGTLRSNIQSVDRGQMSVKDAVAGTNTKQGEFEERIQAYKDMKSFAANVVAAVVGTIVAVVTTILTGGAAAGFWAAVLAGAQVGAYSAIAAVAVKEVIQGGSYSVVEEGTAEVLLGAVTGAIGGGAKQFFGGLKSLETMKGAFDTKMVKVFGFLGPGSAGKLSGAIASNIPSIPESLVNNVSSTVLNGMITQEGFFRTGWEGASESMLPAIAGSVGKDILVNTISQGVLRYSGLHSEGPTGSKLTHGLTKGTEHLVESGTDLAYDYAAAEGRLSEKDVIKALIKMTIKSVDKTVSGYQKASTMLSTLNTASADQLVGFQGITLDLAKKIVAWREANGPFKKMEQLDSVPDMPKDVAENVYKKKKATPLPPGDATTGSHAPPRQQTPDRAPPSGPPGSA